MTNKKYQVFISSTYLDLILERNSVLESLIELGHIPAGMELFPASNSNQWFVIQKIIKDCDYYILIIGDRYGSLSSDGISYTEMEYDYAKSCGIPILTFIRKRNNADHSKTDNDDKLNAFKKKTENILVKYFSDNFDLKSKVTVSLIEIFKSTPRPGFIKLSKWLDGLPSIEDIITDKIQTFYGERYTYYRNGNDNYSIHKGDFNSMNESTKFKYKILLHSGNNKIFIDTIYSWNNDEEVSQFLLRHSINKFYRLQNYYVTINQKIEQKHLKIKVKCIIVVILGDLQSGGFGFDKHYVDEFISEEIESNINNSRITFIKYTDILKLNGLWFQSLLDEKPFTEE